jgi:hypothetical protein
MRKSTDSLDRYARAIAADRNFDAAATSYIEAFVNWRRTLGGFNKVISSGARRRILKNILYLHFSNATDNPDDGATFERLLNQSNSPDGEGRDNCGPRVLRTVISLAQRSGHLAVSQGWYDRRLKILRPTDMWIAQEGERHEAALASLALLAQDRSRFATRPRGPALVGRLAIGFGRGDWATGVTLGEPDGSMRALVALDGGIATAFSVTDAWIRGKRVPSHKEIGASFRLSASQARKILRLAADHSLVNFDRDGKISDASGLADACRRLVAHEFALYALSIAPFEAAVSEPVVAPAFMTELRPEHAH